MVLRIVIIGCEVKFIKEIWKGGMIEEGEENGVGNLKKSGEWERGL